MKPEELAELMQTLDDAWNAGPDSKLWETFRKRHKEDVAVYWPGKPEPTDVNAIRRALWDIEEQATRLASAAKSTDKIGPGEPPNFISRLDIGRLFRA